MSKLKRARKYEQESQKLIPAEQRPVYHMTPAVGWMNDPNGFSVFQDTYHLFYQYYPYDTKWGDMHWGHNTTKDFIKWERQPAALAPDENYESGCFSGGAIEHEDFGHLMMYTAHLEKEKSDGTTEKTETQCIAYGDGCDYVKYTQNPVIGVDQIPSHIQKADFRDPKIWIEDGVWNVIVCGKNQDEDGEILLYQSKDAKQWKFVATLAKSSRQYGKMWECPDVFQIGDKTFFVVSPMEMMAGEDLEFHNGHQTIYLSGNYDKKNHTFSQEAVRPLDYGLDFYAPQSLGTKDGRRVLVGWMQSWENYMTPEDYKWSGMMTVPREITVKEDRLCQMPVREIERYHRNAVKYQQVTVGSEKVELQQIKGRVIDMDVQIRPGDYQSFQICLAENEIYRTAVTYKPQAGHLTFDRKYSGLKQDIIDSRTISLLNDKEGISLRILLDWYSVEIFVNDGEQTMTSLIYTPREADGISFRCDGTAQIDVRKYDIVVED